VFSGVSFFCVVFIVLSCVALCVVLYSVVLSCFVLCCLAVRCVVLCCRCLLVLFLSCVVLCCLVVSCLFPYFVAHCFLTLFLTVQLGLESFSPHISYASFDAIVRTREVNFLAGSYFILALSRLLSSRLVLCCVVFLVIFSASCLVLFPTKWTSIPAFRRGSSSAECL
jgi:hypothetical protein